MTKLSAIEAMLAKCTPGEWAFHPESLGPISVWADCENSAGREVRQAVASVGSTYNHLDVTLYGEQNKREVADARIIARAPSLLRELIERVRKAEKVVEAAKDVFDVKRPGYHDCIDDGLPECEWCVLEKALAEYRALDKEKP